MPVTSTVWGGTRNNRDHQCLTCQPSCMSSQRPWQSSRMESARAAHLKFPSALHTGAHTCIYMLCAHHTPSTQCSPHTHRNIKVLEVRLITVIEKETIT